MFPRCRPALPPRPVFRRRGVGAFLSSLELAMTGALATGIAVAATVVSIGIARAQSINAMADPDTGLVLAMLAAAAGVMGLLSALAVRMAGRFRQD